MRIVLKSKIRKRKEEIVNSTSHGIGVIIAIACTVLLIVKASFHGTAWHIVTFSIFGAGMINLYTASTLFHSAFNPKKKLTFLKFDYSSIYVLIASTYTPFALVGIKGAFGWVVFGLVWLMAAGGIIFKIWFDSPRYRTVSAWLYVAMGFTGIIAIVPMVKNVPNISLWFLLAGCLAYFVSVIFYLIERIPYGHGIFHIFVIGGSICHFFSLLFLI